MAVYGHRECRSNVEVVDKTTFDAHKHGNITRDGKISGVSEVRILITDASGNIVATRTVNADLTINGTITASKVVGAVYA